MVTEHGDFDAYYAVNLKENENGIGSIPVTISLMNEWGVSAEQIQTDAMAADQNRGVVLMDMNEMVKSMIFGGESENLLHEKLDIEAIENPMFCLTNTQKMNGASLLLQEDIRKQIGECLGSDYFVLPSSIHEVLILPDNGMLEVPELNAVNMDENVQAERSIYLLMSIFLYGFIAVITLIGVTNIFNTITSNLELRQKEFAMLKSVGMTRKEFNRMINLETIFYSIKALIYGIALGSIGSYLVYLATASKLDYGYHFPLLATIISIVAVFVLVYIIMRYSMSKINKQNIIETIRKDNI